MDWRGQVGIDVTVADLSAFLQGVADQCLIAVTMLEAEDPDRPLPVKGVGVAGQKAGETSEPGVCVSRWTMVAIEDLQLLTVILTARCNLRCRYCFRDAKRARSMTWDTLQAALDLVVRSRQPVVQVLFTGGEPLLDSRSSAGPSLTCKNAAGNTDGSSSVSTRTGPCSRKRPSISWRATVSTCR